MIRFYKKRFVIVMKHLWCVSAARITNDTAIDMATVAMLPLSQRCGQIK